MLVAFLAGRELGKMADFGRIFNSLTGLFVDLCHLAVFGLVLAVFPDFDHVRRCRMEWKTGSVSKAECCLWGILLDHSCYQHTVFSVCRSLDGKPCV